MPRTVGAKNLRAWELHRLLTEMAIGDSSDAELAAEFRVTEGTISATRYRHKDWLEAKLAEWKAQYDPLWATKKDAAVQVLCDRLSEINDILVIMFADARQRDESLRRLAESTGEEYRGELLPDGREYRAYTKLQCDLVRQILDATGQLPQRGQVEVSVERSVLQDYTEFVIDPDGTFHPLSGSNVDHDSVAVSGL